MLGEGTVMKTFAWTLALALVACGGIVPSAAAQGRTLGQTVDDVTLTAAVKAKLVADRAQNLFKVDVDSVNGVIRLKGTVVTEGDRIEAERLARRTSGVRDVINELRVEARAGDTLREPAASPRTQ